MGFGHLVLDWKVHNKVAYKLWWCLDLNKKTELKSKNDRILEEEGGKSGEIMFKIEIPNNPKFELEHKWGNKESKEKVESPVDVNGS